MNKNEKIKDTFEKKPKKISPFILFFSTNTPPASHLKHPLFQSLSRFTEISFVRIKRNQFVFRGGSTSIQPQSTRGWGHLTGLSTPRDGAVKARPTLAGRQRQLTGHKYLLRNKLSHRDVSCRFFLWRKGLSPLHAVGVINASSSGRCGWAGVQAHMRNYHPVVVEQGSEHICATTMEVSVWSAFGLTLHRRRESSHKFAHRASWVH